MAVNAPSGQIDIYQDGPDGGISGTSISDVLIDVAGYYVEGTAGPTELPPVGAFMTQQIVKRRDRSDIRVERDQLGVHGEQHVDPNTRVRADRVVKLRNEWAQRDSNP